jgi:hypothetical protein
MLARISLVAAAILGLVLFATVGRVIYHEATGGAASIRAQVEARATALAGRLRASLPVQIDEITRLVGVEVDDERFTYFYTLAIGQDEIGEDAVRRSVLGSVDATLCADGELAWLSNRGMTFVYSYIDRDGNFFAEVPVPPGVCEEGAAETAGG